MRPLAKTLAAVGALCFGMVSTHVHAAWFSLPSNLKTQWTHMAFETPALAPFAYSRFCVHYSDDCREHGHVFRKARTMELTIDRWNELMSVNRQVNASIIPVQITGPNTFDSWRVAPRKGDCNDFAVTKRHELLMRGWPSRALLLAEVVTPAGEHHMILVVRTRSQDLVLDNLTGAIKSWSKTPYQWVRVQTPSNPNLWASISAEQGQMKISANFM